MGVKHFTELRAWQAANRLRIAIIRFTSRPPAMHDRRFCNDIRASIGSVCSNLSEGFGRFSHGEFAQFVKIARGSLSETQDHLIEAQQRRYVAGDEFEEMWSVSIEGMRSVNGLFTYLSKEPTPPSRMGLYEKDPDALNNPGRRKPRRA